MGEANASSLRHRTEECGWRICPVRYFVTKKEIFPVMAVPYPFLARKTKRVISEGTPRRQEKPFHSPVPGLT